MILHEWLTEAVRTQGSAKAIVYRDTYLSWRGLQHRVERRAQEFKLLGIGKGHWVGLMLGNVPDFTILTLALSRVGATVVPIDPTTGPRDLAVLVEHAQLRALITRPRGGLDAAPGEAAEAAAPEPEPDPFDFDFDFDRPVRRTKPKRPVRYEMRVESRPDPEVRRPNELVESRRRLQGTLLTCSLFKKIVVPTPTAAVVLITNDAQGEPKGVIRSSEQHAAVVNNAVAALEATSSDRILTISPLHHAYAFDLGLSLALRLGATLHLEDEVAPKRIITHLKEQEITLLPSVPSLYGNLARIATAKPFKVKGARYLASGSSLPEELAEEFRDKWGHRIRPLLHSTETGIIAWDDKALTPGSVGKPIAGLEVRVGDGKLTAGVVGPLWVRGTACAQRFLGPGQRPSETTRAEPTPIGAVDGEGWLRTGDAASRDKAGRLFLAAREDRLLKVDGKRVAPAEVEGCLEQLSKVEQARVHVEVDAVGAPILVARVVVGRKVTIEEITAHCAKNLAHFKVPRRIELVDELPPTGAS
jgi:long-chain acyl-CoA synthetase